MENKNTYGLSIKEAVKIIIIYYIIIGSFIALPLDIVIHRVNFGSHLFIKELIFCINDLIFKVSVVILLLIYVKQRGAEKLKFHDNLNIKLLVSTAFIFLSYGLVCANSLDLLLSKIPVDDSTIKNFNLLNQNVYLSFLTTVIVAPIVEEIIMRGIILEGLLKKYSPFIAIVSSSLIFGIAHFNIPQLISAFLGGMILGAVYFKTRSLILTIVGHACNNIMNFFDIPINIIALVGGIIVLALAVFIFVKNANKTSKIEKVHIQI